MPSWSELKRYLDRKINGWHMYKSSDHWYYYKELETGETIYTKCSRGSGQIGKSKWREILKQMRITQEDFNRG